MKVVSTLSVVIFISVIIGHSGSYANASESAYSDFMKKDRKAFEEFRYGKTKPAQSHDKSAEFRKVSPQRKRAMEIYSEYLRLSRILDNPDPKKGYNRRIKKLRNHLFPTGRAWYWEEALWSEKDVNFKYPFLQELEVRAKKIRLERDKLVKAWNDEGFRSKLGHRPLDECYGRTVWYFYLDKSVFPPALCSNQVDYVISHMDKVWPTNTPAVVSSASVPSAPPDVVVHENPPSAEPPPEVPEIDETVSEENVERMKPWDEMTPEERHRALLENRPEAWQGLSRDLHNDMCGTNTNGIPLVKAALSCSNVTAVSTNIAIANLPPPAPVPAGKSWDEMTPQERHQAIKMLNVSAWDAMHDALLSGNTSRIKDVIKALDAKPPEITDTARAFAYWHGYQTGQMEAATNPSSSALETIVASYKIPELMKIVRKGYADGKAGTAPQYPNPNIDPFGGLLDGIPDNQADWVQGGHGNPTN